MRSHTDQATERVTERSRRLVTLSAHFRIIMWTFEPFGKRGLGTLQKFLKRWGQPRALGGQLRKS
jgi:hypothetical protein